MHSIFLSGFGTLFFVGSHVTIRKILQSRFRDIFSDTSIYVISCRLVSALQGVLTSTVGIIIASSCKDILKDTHWLTLNYAFFVLPYFPYDLWAMYAYNIRVHDDLYKYLNLEDRIVLFIKLNKLMIAHHLVIPCVLMPLVLCLKNTKGDYFFGAMLTVELVIPFISAREILSQLNMKDTRMYVYTSLGMVVMFFACRISLFPYLFYRYAVYADIPLTQVPFHIPLKCTLSCLLILAPQVWSICLLVTGFSNLKADENLGLCKNNLPADHVLNVDSPSLATCNLALKNSEVMTTTTSLAVVLYDEDKILPHELTSRTFYLADEKFVIEQNWQGVGVAAVVWDSAVVLGEYLQDHRHLIQGKKVLELGAGTGLAGMVAAALGADVIVTERESAMPHLTSTVLANSPNRKHWKIKASVLDWTQPIHYKTYSDVDVVLGADIIYIEETFNDLLKVLMSLTHNRIVQVLLSCKIRYDRDRNFLKMMEEHFSINEIYEDHSRHIKILSLQRL
ncbi:protein N-lysine methyltransferase METTL21A [Biomphalaria glabrata]|nr:protein N-lysine methyltransferase METTL21A [Biomphalaria glabrata]